MAHQKGMAAAFVNGPANPEDPAELGLFYRQAYWLARCSKLVYPPDPADKEDYAKYQEENELDRSAEETKQAYKKLRPWWKVFGAMSKEQIEAQEAWHAAETKWAAAARHRVTKQIKDWWGPSAEEVEVKFYSCHGTQYFIAGDDKTIIVCFRGTEMNKRRDILADILTFQCTDERQTGKIHVGFFDALDVVWRESDDIPHGESLSRLLREDSQRNRGQRVWITGHSLGGALGAALADRLVLTETLDEEDIGGVFTYGQPRVGDKKFAQGYPLKARHFRFINNNDLVPRIPPKSLRFISLLLAKVFGTKSGETSSAPKTSGGMSYRHMGRAAFINRSGSVKLFKPGVFKWRIALFFGRLGSRFTALFKQRGFMNRLAPGVVDHGMSHYRDALDGFPLAQDPSDDTSEQDAY